MPRDLAVSSPSLSSANHLSPNPGVNATNALTGSLPLLQVIAHAVGKMYPRVTPETQVMKDASNGAGRRLQQAEVFPDLNMYAANTSCDKPVTAFTFPRSDLDNCSVPFLFNGVDNPPIGLTQADIDTINPTFNALALGTTFENENDTSSELCTYTRISRDTYATAGHCLPSASTPESYVALAAGYERANQPCIAGKASIIEQKYMQIPGASIFDAPTIVEDFGLVRLPPSNAVLDINAYPIAQLSTRLPDIGETVYLLGHPAGVPATWRKTEVLDIDLLNFGSLTLNPTFKLNTATLQGASGGPVVDTYGEVIGFISSGVRDRLSDIQADGTIEYGPMLAWAVSSKGALENSVELQNIVQAQNAANTAEIQSLLPDGFQRSEACLFNVIQGQAVLDALAFTQNIQVPASSFGQQGADIATGPSAVNPQPAAPVAEAPVAVDPQPAHNCGC